MSQAVKRACDACHRRKVKCDGVNPCRNCSAAGLACSYNAIPQKKGPKGSRAKVISELRETQRQTSLSARVQARMNGIPPPPATEGLAPTPGLLTSDLVKECAQFFFEHMNAQAPILDRRQIDQQVLYMEQNRDAYCLMASLCAFVMLQPGMSMPANDAYNLDLVPGANIIASQILLEEAVRVRKGYEYLDQVTINALATNFFLFGCHYGMEMHDKAWYYLREATTMIQMNGMDKEEFYMPFDISEGSRLRRLYWLYYIVERAYAIRNQRPLTLQSTIKLPTLGDDPSDPLSHQLNGFILLINLYRPFDDAFTNTWNKTRSVLSQQYINGLQKQLNDAVQSAFHDPSWNDLGTNQQWLKNTVWQLSNGGAVATEGSMSFQVPVNVSREMLMNMASQFPGQGMELLNSGLLEKLVEGTYSMTEYLSMQPASRDPFAIGPQEHLNQIIHIVAASRNGDYRFLPLLMSKVSEVLPRLANPMLQNAPETAPMANVDIFDGFGNAGMAQPPHMQMPALDEYERKFSVEEYEKKYALDMTGNTPDSHATSNPGNTPPVARQPSEIANSFVGSPPMMSPGLEFTPHGVYAAPTPMSEMVMSPMTTHPPPQQHHQHMNQQPSNHIHDPMGQQHMGMAPQNMRPGGMQPAHHMNGMMNVRQSPQRQDSFAMAPGQPHHFQLEGFNFNSLR
ncbi:hypothetical protein ACHAPX_004793 [Trichoderma viride]